MTSPSDTRLIALRTCVGVVLGLACVSGCQSAGVADIGNPEPASRIAYLAYTDAYWQVWVVDPGTGATRQVTQSVGDKTRVTWFGDGHALLVCTQAGRLVRVDPDSGQELPLPVVHEGIRDAAVSPDGEWVAFSATAGDTPDTHDLWVVRTSGSDLQRIVRMKNLQAGPTWSQDGEWIYFHSGPVGGNNDILRVRKDGSEREQIVFNHGFAFEPALNRDGRLAFSSNSNGNYDIWVETEPYQWREVAPDPAVDASPSWSPDGTAVVFESARAGSLNLWIVDELLDPASEPRRLTAHEVGARAPQWWGTRGVNQ